MKKGAFCPFFYAFFCGVFTLQAFFWVKMAVFGSVLLKLGGSFTDV